MKVYESKDIRNVGIVGHGHSGKTSLVAGLLFTSGAVNRLTRVDEGNTPTDYDDEEIQRKLTVSTSIAALEWKKYKINLFDTPGFNIFINDTYSTMIADDATLVVVDAVAGVEVQTEKTWGFADEFHLPRAILINKLDRERARLRRAPSRASRTTSDAPPFPSNSPSARRKISKASSTWSVCGRTPTRPMAMAKVRKPTSRRSMPKPPRPRMKRWSRSSPKAMTRCSKSFSTKARCPPNTSSKDSTPRSRNCAFSRFSARSALRNIGADRILDFIGETFPSPIDHAAVHGKLNGQDVTREISDKGPASAFVFKTTADPFAGRITFFKVMSGCIKNDQHLIDVQKSTDERLAHIGSPLGKTIQPVNELHAGDIGAVAKLKDALTGHTLADKSSLIEFEPVHLPEPSIAFAVEAKSRQDEDRMGNAINRLLEEDLSLRFYRDPQTKDFLVAGAGQQHVEVVVSRMKTALRRRRDVEGAQDPVSRNHSRQCGRAGPPQETDRRPRTVRRLLDPHVAAAARRQVRVCQQHLWRRDPQELHSRDRKGNRRDRREGISCRVSR